MPKAKRRTKMRARKRKSPISGLPKDLGDRRFQLGMMHLVTGIRLQQLKEDPRYYENWGLKINVPKAIATLERRLRDIENHPDYRLAEPYGA